MAGNIAGIIRRLLVILIAVPLLCSCGKYYGQYKEDPCLDEDMVGMALHEVVEAFSEESDAYSGNAGMLSESPFVWESGSIIPVWTVAEGHLLRNGKRCVVVPVYSSVSYYILTDGQKSAVRCSQMLIAEKRSSGEILFNIVFPIPSSASEDWLDSDGYSGLLVYTNLCGKFRKVEKYGNGKLTDGVYFSRVESESAKERHIVYLSRILEGISVFKMSTPIISSRCTPVDTVEYNDTLNPSYCDGSCFPDLWWQNPDFNFYNDSIQPLDTVDFADIVDDGNGELGNGGGGSSGSPKEIGGGSEDSQQKPKDCSEYIGNKEYYKERNNDYKKRHGNVNVQTYYISYGLYYCDKFILLRDSDKLSTAGKKWVDKTLVSLQEKLEELIQSNPLIEDNLQSLTEAAFKTHPEAYIESGILDLGMQDKLQIITVIRKEDLLSKLGREQVFEVVKAQLAYYMENPEARKADASYILKNWSSIKKLLKDTYFETSATKGNTLDEDDKLNEIRDLLFEEIINYFYDSVEGFDIDY
jgi:hypothetical protein